MHNLSRSTRALAAGLVAVALTALPAPATLGVAGLEVATRFPAVQVDPGGEVIFPLTVTTAAPERVGLAVTSAPEGFETTLRGGGQLVDAVFTSAQDPEQPVELELEVQVPAEAAPDTYQVILQATGSAGTTDLALDLRVGDVGGGGVTVTTEFPVLRGEAENTFSFSATLTNETAQEIDFALEADVPPGWTSEISIEGSEQAATAPVGAGEDQGVTLSVTPSLDEVAGTYPIVLRAAGGPQQAQADLQVEITGTTSLELATADGRLNATVSGGGSTTVDLVIENTGSADLAAVTLEATPPTDWEVDFEPETLELLPARERANVRATITPAGDAVTGDYAVTIDASTEGGDDSIELRTTVETSSIWGFVGLALIALVVVGLLLVFRRYGRR